MKRSHLSRATYIAIFMAICCLLIPGPASAEPIAVIVNKDNPINSLSKEEVKMIYSDEMVNWPQGGKIEVYDLDASNPLRQEFSLKVLGEPAIRVEQARANKRITNTAKNVPNIIRSKILVLYKVRSNKDAIGYMPLSLVTSNKNVKIVAEIK